MKFFRKTWFVFAFALIFAVACSANSENKDNTEGNKNNTSKEAGENDDVHTAPAMEDLDPEDPKTEAIQYGEEVFNETNTVLPENVGNELSCQSCHADGGRSQASSLVGVAADYPQYRPREGVTFTLEDRINGCMIRSMNGEMIDTDSEEMRAMIAYMTYLSEGVEIGQERPWVVVNNMEEVPEPDVDNGEELYADNCLSCHGDDGAGTGPNSGPALWGDNSFNDGAGMGRLTKAAGFIQRNMPVGQEESLSDQEAADIAAFMLSQDRPEFDGHDKDFPDGKKPTDIITQDRRDQIQAGEFDWSEIENVVPKD